MNKLFNNESVSIELGVKVPLEDIVLDESYRIRDLDSEVVKEYEALPADSFPAIGIDQNNKLLSGWHRYEAARSRGDLFITADIREFDCETEAWAFAVSENSIHGKQYSRAEKRALAKVALAKGMKSKRVAAMLAVPERTMQRWNEGARQEEVIMQKRQMAEMHNLGKTQQEIADELGIDQSTVARRLANEASRQEEVIMQNGQMSEMHKAGQVGGDGPTPPTSLPSAMKDTDPAKPTKSGGLYGHSKGDPEWYTPAYLITAARNTMGSINTDPASNHEAQEWIQADTYYTAESNGLEQEWYGNVWLNPPYKAQTVKAFTDKLLKSDNVTQFCTLTNHATETKWGQDLITASSAVCFIRSRVTFIAPKDSDKKDASQQTGQMICYKGENVDKFIQEYSKYGIIMALLENDHVQE